MDQIGCSAKEKKRKKEKKNVARGHGFPVQMTSSSSWYVLDQNEKVHVVTESRATVLGAA